MRLYCVSPSGSGAALAEAARWADRAGLDGMLIGTGNGVMEPWSVAQYVVERTECLAPLVTVQPLYMHPYMTARMVSAIASMLGRRVDLALVAGGPDLRALGCTLGDDERHERLLAYGRIVGALLRADDALTFDSPHYRLVEAVIYPTPPPRLAPRIFVDGPTGSAVARTLRAGQLIDLSHDLVGRAPLPRSAVRAGIIARDTGEEARRVARERDRTSGSCLVGSHAEVAQALVPYQRAGVAAVVMTDAVTEDDLGHAMTAMRLVGA